MKIYPIYYDSGEVVLDSDWIGYLGLFIVGEIKNLPKSTVLIESGVDPFDIFVGKSGWHFLCSPFPKNSGIILKIENSDTSGDEFFISRQDYEIYNTVINQLVDLN